jgi:two-component system OmpR family response regulator/two-component system alkaline phosphatase synthesis response regulator PhoP
MTLPRRALVVEDEVHIRDLVCLHLDLEGFSCTGIGDGREALTALAREHFDLVVLDLMIPQVDGFALCRAARRDGPNQRTPILMLTARREESDKVLGLESGADDYLTKPFGVRELVARVRALMRRSDQTGHAPAAGPETAESDLAVPPPLHVADLEIDAARQRVMAGGHPVELTTQEFRLLHTLASHPGIVFSREALLRRVWRGEANVTDRSVDALVKRLRKKIEPSTDQPRYIVTVWGAGYKFTDV